MIITGNSTGYVRPNWAQTDSGAADYILGKEAVDAAIAAARSAAEGAQKTAAQKAAMAVVSIALEANGWNGSTQRVAVAGVLADTAKCHVIPAPVPESHGMYYDRDVRCTKQENGYLTFACEETPTEDLTVTVALLAEGGMG